MKTEEIAEHARGWNAIGDIMQERNRQMTAEGWTEEHDDTHADGELANAAACYAMTQDERDGWSTPPSQWPWSRDWWKPTMEDRRRELVKAGALIVAEIERLDRAAEKEKTNAQP